MIEKSEYVDQSNYNMQSKFNLGLLILMLTVQTLFAQSDTTDSLQLKTSNGHAIQYFVSLPNGWTSSKKWPVVLVLEAAEKEYKLNANRFVRARGRMPFIIIAPIHTNNGNQGRRDPNLFPYSKETWDYIDRVGDCQFNDEGIRQILTDIEKLYNAEDRIYITGFEAGAHQLWSIVFNHPELLKAAAPVAGNYRGRCVDVSAISNKAFNANIPIVAFVGAKDDYFGPKGSLFNQWLEPKELALKNGFKNVDVTVVPEQGHVPMPKEVMDYFYRLYSAGAK